MIRDHIKATLDPMQGWRIESANGGRTSKDPARLVRTRGPVDEPHGASGAGRAGPPAAFRRAIDRDGCPGGH
jgi:hypothetical protein